MRSTFTPDYLARAGEQLGWDESPAGQAKRQEDLALLQELMAATDKQLEADLLISQFSTAINPQLKGLDAQDHDLFNHR